MENKMEGYLGFTKGEAQSKKLRDCAFSL